jgi:hypothetical protein
MHVEEHPSPLMVFPSSHCSPLSMMPFPHTAAPLDPEVACVLVFACPPEPPVPAYVRIVGLHPDAEDSITPTHGTKAMRATVRIRREWRFRISRRQATASHEEMGHTVRGWSAGGAPRDVAR